MFGFGDEAKKVGEGVKLVGDALDGLFTSDEERLTHKQIMAKLNDKKLELSRKMSLIEAKGNWFNSGWRPFIGWISGLSLGLFFIPQYVMGAYIYINHYIVTGTMLEVYPVSPDAVLELVAGLLGMAAIRSFDKANGVAAK